MLTRQINGKGKDMDPVVQVGDVIQTPSGKLGLVIRLGRGQVRSALVWWEEGTPKVRILLEIDYWLKNGYSVFSRKPSNAKLARKYFKAYKNDLPEI